LETGKDRDGGLRNRPDQDSRKVVEKHGGKVHGSIRSTARVAADYTTKGIPQTTVMNGAIDCIPGTPARSNVLSFKKSAGCR